MIGGKEVRPGYQLPRAAYGSRIINLRASVCKKQVGSSPSVWDHLGNYRISSDMKCIASANVINVIIISSRRMFNSSITVNNLIMNSS